MAFDPDEMDVGMRRLELELFPDVVEHGEDMFLKPDTATANPDRGVQRLQVQRLQQALSGQAPSEPAFVALSNTQLVNMVVDQDLSPSEFVLLLSQYELANLRDLEKLVQGEDVSGWLLSFLPTVRDLISSHKYAKKDLSQSAAKRASATSFPGTAQHTISEKTAGKRPMVYNDDGINAVQNQDRADEMNDHRSFCSNIECDSSPAKEDDALASRDDNVSSPSASSREEYSGSSSAGPSTATTIASAATVTASLSTPVTSANPVAATTTTPLMPYETTSFPPGRTALGFVPFGTNGLASVAQGNFWPIEQGLRDAITVAEVDGSKLRGTRLTYEQLLTKYDAWQVTASTLRGRVRNKCVAPEHRSRIVEFSDSEVAALRQAVPLCTNSSGVVSWARVREEMIQATGRPFGVGTLHKTYRDLP